MILLAHDEDDGEPECSTCYAGIQWSKNYEDIVNIAKQQSSFRAENIDCHCGWSDEWRNTNHQECRSGKKERWIFHWASMSMIRQHERRRKRKFGLQCLRDWWNTTKKGKLCRVGTRGQDVASLDTATTQIRTARWFITRTATEAWKYWFYTKVESQGQRRAEVFRSRSQVLEWHVWATGGILEIKSSLQGPCSL